MACAQWSTTQTYLSWAHAQIIDPQAKLLAKLQALEERVSFLE